MESGSEKTEPVWAVDYRDGHSWETLKDALFVPSVFAAGVALGAALMLLFVGE